MSSMGILLPLMCQVDSAGHAGVLSTRDWGKLVTKGWLGRG